jgi:hypothetical protein
MSAERLAVQRCGRRQAGPAILRRCPCGDHIRFNGLFDSAERGLVWKPVSHARGSVPYSSCPFDPALPAAHHPQFQ